VTDLDEFKKHCDAKFSELDDRIDKLVISQEKCVESIDKLTAETADVVELYRSAQSVITIGVALQKFGVWIVKWPVIGAGMYSIYHWLQGRGA
jgi:hypothetical protein